MDIAVTSPTPWDRSSVRGLLDIVRQDRAANGQGRLAPATQAIIVHRLGCWLADPDRHRVVFAVGWPVYRTLFALVRNGLGFEVNHEVVLGRGVRFSHQHGVVVAPGTEIGDNTLVHHDVTIGQRWNVRDPGPRAVGARIGRDVTIGAGVVIIGAVRIGDGASIGPNAVVVQDVPEGASVVAPPSRILRLHSNP